MKRIILSITLTLIVAGVLLFAQVTFPENGIKDIRESSYAFRNATIYLNSDEVQENATLLIDDGRVVAVGKVVQIPDGTTVYDLKGRIIYSSFLAFLTKLRTSFLDISLPNIFSDLITAVSKSNQLCPCSTPTIYFILTLGITKLLLTRADYKSMFSKY